MRKMNILITAGPTRERIDPVRFISNRSSGKMGYALAEAVVNAGHDAVLISGPVSIPPPDGLIRYISVESAEEMACEVRKYANYADIIIMAAAVADYRPKAPTSEKIKKSDKSMTLELERTTDILAELGEKYSSDTKTVVGFAAETENLIENAQIKLKKKRLDWIIANDVSRKDSGFQSDSNSVTMISAGGKVIEIPLMNKKEVAEKIIKEILE